MENQFFEMLKIGTVALGVVFALIAAALLFFAVKHRTAEKEKKAFTIVTSVIVVICLVLCPVISYFTTLYTNSINSAMTLYGGAVEETQVDDWKELAYTIGEEGMVLLENKNNVLPLEAGTNVNLLGYYAYNPYYSGSGSGAVSAEDSYSVVKSLESVNLKNNPAIEASGIYVPPVKEDTGGVGFMTANFYIDEVPESVYTGDVSFESMSSYSDTAIVVLGRSGGEGADLTKYEEGDYLKLTEEEEALLGNARSSFETLIVIINAANHLEMGWVEEFNVDAVIWAGLPGPYGFEALGRILTGEANPSGHLVDTLIYDNDSNPANENFGHQVPDNSDTHYYVDYVEGIYVGYKWYETAYAEKAVITNTKTGETFDYSNFEDIVAYPFGYGLSYTTFSQEITGGTLRDGGSLSADGTYTVEVTVKNTGSVAGKSVVQLYVTVPYTEYDKTNLVEKSAVSLVVYGKTAELKPGEEEVVTLEFTMEDLASYDSSYKNADGTSGSYMLDEGDYVFTVRSDSHTVIDTVTGKLGSTHFFSGDNKRVSDYVAATNQFADVARGKYLSRQNGFANYAEAMGSVVPSIRDLSYATTNNLYDPALDEVVTKTYKEGVDYAVDGDLTINDMIGVDYDDPKWDELVAQLTIEEMLALTGNSLYSTPATASIGLEATKDSDGPLGLSSMFSSDLVTVAFPCVPLLTATWNTDLAYEMGRAVADQAEINGVSAWYAPGMNTHRSAYSGRNFEYYSECGTLARHTAGAEVAGARDNGLIVCIKHFFLNDQETHRAYIFTYSNEQAIREIYMKPFEYSVKESGVTYIMNSMNYLGDNYIGADVELWTNVVRGEWNFRGAVLTDMDEGNEIRNFWSCIRAGVDRWLGFNPTDIVADDNADIYYLQRACHNILFMQVSGNSYATKVMDWQSYRTYIYIELVALAVAGVVALGVCHINPKKKENV